MRNLSTVIEFQAFFKETSESAKGWLSVEARCGAQFPDLNNMNTIFPSRLMQSRLASNNHHFSLH